MNVQKRLSRSSLFGVKDLNNEVSENEKRVVKVNSLDNLFTNLDNSWNLGIKIDTEGFKLEVVLGSKDTLRATRIVMTQVRHNF